VDFPWGTTFFFPPSRTNYSSKEDECATINAWEGEKEEKTDIDKRGPALKVIS
jgi:hypothetical protein